MNRRLTIIGLAALAAIAVAVPALGQTSVVTPSVQGLSVRALAKARLALLTARSAKSESRRAARTAQAAVNAAEKATGPAGPAGPAGASAPPVQKGAAMPVVSTESETYVQLPGGPAITVTVPSSGLIEVWAQVTFEGRGAVAIFEDGGRMPGQSEGCAPEENGGALLSSYIDEEITLATPTSVGLLPVCGSEGPPAPVLFQTSPGQHTFELRYEFGECGCGGGGEEGEAIFSKRSLFVAPRL